MTAKSYILLQISTAALVTGTNGKKEGIRLRL